MINKIFLFFTLLLTACTIEEVPRQPLLSTPLGLTVKHAPNAAARGIGVFFTANNPEIYFTGFAIYISTRKEDFTSFTDNTQLFPIRPTAVPGNQAQILNNFNTNVSDTNLTIFIGGSMAFPERRFYPPPPEHLILAPNTPTEDPEFTFTAFNQLPNGDPFVAGTTYYFAVYAYSSVDNIYSLPSNIAEIVYTP